MAMAAYTSSGK